MPSTSPRTGSPAPGWPAARPPPGRRPPTPAAARLQRAGRGAVKWGSLSITQGRSARSRLAGDPPDIMVAPKLAKMGLFEFHRAAECIELGRQAAERAIPDILELIKDSETVA